MEAITVFAKSPEQSRALKAFLKASKINYAPTTPSELEKLEAHLTPAQKRWWVELKNNIEAVNKNETTDSVELEDFLKELEDEDKIGSVVSA